MPNMVMELVVDRVDLVDEGANSASFIELYKRKEHIMTIEEILKGLDAEAATLMKAKIDAGETAEQDLAKAKEKLDEVAAELEVAKEKVPCECDGEADETGTCKTCGKKKLAKAGSAFDETETMKSLPKEMQEYVTLLKSQKAAAEEAVRKANEATATSVAIAKAAELKSLPVENGKLVSILKGASKELVEVLTTISAAIDSTVLTEVGKSNTAHTAIQGDANAAWAKIETEADKIVKSAGDTITKQKAIAEVIKSKPELYKAYLDGGAE